MGNGGFFPGIEQPTNTVDHLPPSSAKVKNVWTYTYTPHKYLHGMARDNLPFTSVQYKPFQYILK
jgi:hypothetical protein